MSIRFYTDENQQHQSSYHRWEDVERLAQGCVENDALWIVVRYAGVERCYKFVADDAALSAYEGKGEK